MSRNKNAERFQDWATKILFTHHLGTKEQKQELSSKLLGVQTKAVQEVFEGRHLSEGYARQDL